MAAAGRHRQGEGQAGRGHAPSAVLAYGSGSGNGPFGLGWSLAGPWEIRRRTSLGVPRYQDDDQHLAVRAEKQVIVLVAR
ncbi:SpvB/TcaC N-terminal domain-containing protein, partial [Klebsiella pneumoniae]